MIQCSCTSNDIVIHCPTICDKGGAVLEDLKLRRVSIGLADMNNDEMPDGTGYAPSTAIMDHRAINGDTLEGEWNLIIYPNVDVTDSNVGRNFELFISTLI